MDSRFGGSLLGELDHWTYPAEGWFLFGKGFRDACHPTSKLIFEYRVQRKAMTIHVEHNVVSMLRAVGFHPWVVSRAPAYSFPISDCEQNKHGVLIDLLRTSELGGGGQ